MPKKEQQESSRLDAVLAGFAKRARERASGAPMADRSHEGISRKHFPLPTTRPPVGFGMWLRDFWRRTAA